ncbi:NUDIX hydrolase [Pseudonocardia sp. RS010]|uniref:NUDIX hydrolase n=1 Tax=Pseudonocardia sp. RS010 TaxID=3385979 RepID=UPI0039A2C14C
MSELPDDGLPIVERDVVRLIVLDAGSRILLLATRDATEATGEVVWQVPGGGIEFGESWADAAVRELREETDLRISGSQLRKPCWRRTATYRYRGARRLQHERIATVQLTQHEPDVTSRGGDDDEKTDCIGARWWLPSEIVSSTSRFYPGSLPSLLPEVLAGTPIDEPFEIWS